MATEVLTGYFCAKSDFTLYTNRTGQNARLIFNYLSLEGTGTSEIRINTPNSTFPKPNVDEDGSVLTPTQNVSYVQYPNLPDIEFDWVEGIVGKNLSSSSLNYGWYWRRWWGWGKNKDSTGDNSNGYLFMNSRRSLSKNFFSGNNNWWKKYDRIMEVPFPNEVILADGHSLSFMLRTATTVDWRKNTTLGVVPQSITYNCLVIPEVP